MLAKEPEPLEEDAGRAQHDIGRGEMIAQNPGSDPDTLLPDSDHAVVVSPAVRAGIARAPIEHFCHGRLDDSRREDHPLEKAAAVGIAEARCENAGSVAVGQVQTDCRRVAHPHITILQCRYLPHGTHRE